MNEFIQIIKATMQSRLSSFKQSILFYPIVFAIGAIILSVITTRFDTTLYTEGVSFDIPYLGSLLFAGSPHAARSILSAISGGWTTILGVTFSVTLVTLQLSSTKYTSHIVNTFEDDKINQLTLGSFISVVVYSLLVLKTVRVSEDPDISFVPIIGVNIAVYLAIITLFIFVIFLHNISSYLRPNMLILRIVERIIHSIRPFELRKEQQINTTIFGNDDDRQFDNNLKSYDIKSKKSGILRSIYWNNVYKRLQEYSQSSSSSSKNLWIEWSKSLGDSIEKDSTIATIYYNKENTNFTPHEKSLSLLNNNNNNNDNNKEDNRISNGILSTVDINKDRNISTDPYYGMEVLRSLAIKAASQFDTDVTNSCITGFFRILNHIFKSKDIAGTPFTLIDNSSKDNNSKENTVLIIIKPKETRLSDTILKELSKIHNKVASQQQISIIEHFANEYVSISKNLLEINKASEFERLTKWYANLLSLSSSSITSFPREFQEEIIVPLLVFKKELSKKYHYLHAVDIFVIYMNDILTNEREKDGNITSGR